MRKIDRTGETKINNFGSKMVIVEDRGYDDVDVYFEQYNWLAENVRYKEFKNGSIRCPFEKRTYAVGFLGEGNYKTSENGELTKYYKVWHSMMTRCYNPKSLEKNPSYIKCEVCEEWHNFQVFAEWFEENYYEIKGETMALDKDILSSKDNKIYSPESCIFVPQIINNLFVKCDSKRGELPIGVRYHKRDKKFMAQCNINGKRTHLGSYNTPEQAFEVYKQAKEEEIKRVAQEYEELIPTELYNAMMNYVVSILD